MRCEFYCRQAKASKKTGKAPIQAAISLNGERKFYNLPLQYNPTEFKRLYEAKKTNELKEYLDSYKFNIEKAIMELSMHSIALTHYNLHEYVKNGGIKTNTLESLFDDYFNNVLSTSKIQQYTKDKYRIVRDLFYTLYNKNMELSALTPNDIRRFIAFLNTQYKQSTINGMMTKLKAIFIYAFENDIMAKNIFNQIKVEKPKPIIEYLTEAELNSIKEKDFNNKRLNTVKDLFLIQAGTGLAYADLAHLTVNDIIFDEKSNQYIIDKERIKTGVRYTCVILPFAMEIMSKYMNNGDYCQTSLGSNCRCQNTLAKNKGNKIGNYLNDNDLPFLPVLSNQKYNGYLKEISDFCGIKKSVHTHLARKTYATFLLNKGVRLEVVSRALGHSSVKISEKFYAKMETDTVVSEIGNILR